MSLNLDGLICAMILILWLFKISQNFAGRANTTTTKNCAAVQQVLLMNHIIKKTFSRRKKQFELPTAS